MTTLHIGVVFNCYVKKQGEVRGEKRVDDIAARNRTVASVQIVSQCLEGLIPGGVLDVKLEDGTTLAMMGRGTVSGQLTTRS